MPHVTFLYTGGGCNGGSPGCVVFLRLFDLLLVFPVTLCHCIWARPRMVFDFVSSYDNAPTLSNIEAISNIAETLSFFFFLNWSSMTLSKIVYLVPVLETCTLFKYSNHMVLANVLILSRSTDKTASNNWSADVAIFILKIYFPFFTSTCQYLTSVLHGTHYQGIVKCQSCTPLEAT